jgi:glycosyltransferase involved in cell wall biosynthesis
VREFANGAAITVDPADPSAIADGLERAVEQADELGARGPELAARYDWSTAAAETLAVYREVTA